MKPVYISEKQIIDWLLEDLAQNILEIVVSYKIKCAGYIEDNVICINPLWGDRTLTLLHEYVHYLYPALEEKQTEQFARKLFKKLTYKQEAKILWYLRMEEKL